MVLRITNKGVEAIAKNCPNITILKLSSCKEITEEGTKAIVESCPELTELYVRYVPLKNISHLSNLTNLRKLDLAHTEITDFSCLRELPHLETLWVHDNIKLEGEELKKFLNEPAQ